MCGIVYSKNFTGRPVAKIIKKKYKKQRNRGYEGFGFYIPETNRLTHNPRERRAMNLLTRENKASEILFHHRFPTSTDNVRNSCHPFSTKDNLKYNYVGVHNGVLYNEKELKLEHDKLGIKYVSEQLDGRFNDSEALIYDIAMYIEGDVSKISAIGSIAFIVVQRTHEGVPVALYFGRNQGNPLVANVTENSITLSSEGEGEIIKAHTLYRLDYGTMDISEERCHIPSSYAYSYNGYVYDDEYYQEDYMYDDKGEPLTDEIEQYFEDLEENYKNKATANYSRLLSECYSNLEDACSLGEYELSLLRAKRDELSDKVEVFDTYSEKEYEDYVNIDDEIYALTQAIDKLREELSGSTQMGFRLEDSKRFIEETVSTID